MIQSSRNGFGRPDDEDLPPYEEQYIGLTQGDGTEVFFNRENIRRISPFQLGGSLVDGIHVQETTDVVLGVLSKLAELRDERFEVYYAPEPTDE